MVRELIVPWLLRCIYGCFGISVVSFTWGNECSNTSHTALVDTCLFSNITLNCTVSSAVNGSLDVEWRLYPDNRSINVSSMMFNNDTSSISFSVSQENVFFLVVQSDDPTNCPVCNISLDISQSTSAIVDAIQSYCKYLYVACYR